MENILYIHHVLTGTLVPYVKRDIEDKRVRLLKQIERAFELTRSWVPLARTSLLKYHLCLVQAAGIFATARSVASDPFAEDAGAP